MNAYFLGNGYRLYSSVFRRFFSSDKFSPFGRGGRNAYAYGVGDPVNHVDPSGAVVQRLAHVVNLKLGRQQFDAGKYTPFYGMRINDGVDPYKLSVLHVEGNYTEVLKHLPMGSIGDYVERYPALKRQIVGHATKRALSLLELSPDPRAMDSSDFPGLFALDWREIDKKVLLSDLRREILKGESPASRREARSKLTKALDELPSAKLRIIRQLKSRLTAVRENRLVSEADWLSEWLN